jgi:hypothetical protein
MKRKDASSEIQKIAREYAKSGKYSSWLLIEHTISAEGYIGAKTALDFPYIRDELMSLCEIANSETEINRREDFSNWLNQILTITAPSIKKSKPTVHFTVRDNSLHIDGETFSFHIRRRFNSYSLEMTREFEIECQRFITKTYESIADSDYRKIKDEKALLFFDKIITKN